MADAQRNTFPEDYNMNLELVTDTVLRAEIEKHLKDDGFEDYIHAFVDSFEAKLDEPDLQNDILNFFLEDGEKRMPQLSQDVPSDVVSEDIDFASEELSYRRYLALYLVAVNYYEIFARKPYVRDQAIKSEKVLHGENSRPDPIEILTDLIIDTDQNINAIISRRAQKQLMTNTQSNN